MTARRLPARPLGTDELVARKPPAEDFPALPRAPVHVVLSDVRGLANVGLAFRLCDNLRVAHLWLCGLTGHPPYPGDPRPPSVAARCEREIRRTAVMAVPYVPWSYRSDAARVVRERKAAGDRVVVLEQAEGALAPADESLEGTLCLVLGHERLGVDPAIVAEADVVLELPVWGMANSINVAMALGIVGYEAARQNDGWGLAPL
ncbi:MAG TPA: TrmH family RNA methyltransferase [Vulgatibacter sp.]|nr:TrmH family RNA methyltransferase [Vulgatibacter sp.]